MTKEIKVIDYVMGTGKSTYLLKKLQQDSSIRYIYVAPLSSEVEDRAKDELAATEVNIPSDKEGLKSEDMLQLLKAGKNIACTHELFKRLTEEHIKYITHWGYTMIIDEVVDFIKAFEKYNDDEINDLFDEGKMFSDEKNNGKISMTWGVREHNHFAQLKAMCDVGMLYSSKYPSNMLNIQIPPSVIEASREVYLLTYMYETSTMCKFMQMHGFTYTKEKIPDLEEREKEKKAQIKSLLNIINLQAVDSLFKRQKDTWFSQSWYGSKGKTPNKENTLLMFKKIDNYLSNNPEFRTSYFFCTPKRVSQWLLINSTKEDESNEEEEVIKAKNDLTKAKLNYLRPRLKEPKKTTRSKEIETENQKNSKYQMWLPSTTRATNIYKERTLCLFLMNIYPNWNVQKYLTDFHEPVDPDKYALSEMLQFIWRGCIRDNKPMDVYIVSSRMKRLLIEWLES